jgi:FAD/FMN-containing dehydrogenase
MRDDARSSIGVHAASNWGLSLSVRGGGHDWAGRSVCHNGLMIDLSAMRRVEVKAATEIAIVAGGATVKDVNDATTPHGLAAVTGSCGTVGMTGLTLGGGYGLLTGKYGLAVDNLREVEVVLADGQLVRASATRNQELFWALRGGGGNFGIVTSIHIRLHRVPSVLGGMIMFPWSEAQSVLRGYSEIVRAAPDFLSVLAGMISGPSDEPVIFLAPAWCGDHKEGAPFISALQKLGDPIITQIGSMPYRDLIGMFDPHLTFGRHHIMRTLWLEALSDTTVSAICRPALRGVHHFR